MIKLPIEASTLISLGAALLSDDVVTSSKSSVVFQSSCSHKTYKLTLYKASLLLLHINVYDHMNSKCCLQEAEEFKVKVN